MIIELNLPLKWFGFTLIILTSAFSISRFISEFVGRTNLVLENYHKRNREKIIEKKIET
ncbi:hypothetical protein GYMLUDRAFT_695608 [Collybiopsis luxurians FD-317 M1]|uniref:Unplaced genomic scaffold GYMLUscaffold_37, whole genome shotgun sequence n=1 Tax=Collybiopsis luxurians FD-317 M1 TaxID=944289 RepID=A0A0D0C7C5_9AGAR|nr:hypothetical protein GYMLUDRAFT_695608 [Collybiopsis luxurians FD-317 M1]